MAFLDQVERRLDLPTAVKQQVIRELVSHFTELKSELVESGMEVSKAESEAEKRLGEPADVAARLNAAHNSASWKSALLCAVPFVCGFVSYSLMSLGVSRILCGVMLAAVTVVGIREIVLGRRPAWLAAWLAGSLYFFSALAFLVAVLLGCGIYAGLKAMATAPVILLLVAGWRVKRWRIFAVAAGIVYMYGLSLFHTSSNFAWDTIMQLGIIALLVMAARATFEIHPHGSASQASLFLLSAFMLYPVLAPFVSAIGNDPAVMGYMAAKSLLYACPVIWFARTPSNARKGFIVLAALLLYPAFDSLFPVGVGWTLGQWVQSFYDSAWAFAAVMLPIWLDAVRSRRDRPSIAR